MKEKLEIRAKSGTYPLWIGTGALKELAGFLRGRNPSKLLIVTDPTVKQLHLDTLLEEIGDDFPYGVHTVPKGEEAKTFREYERLLTFALEEELDRRSLFLAFGGGAVGDLTGFAAATFMRGIGYVQIPTTILAHDSAIGGKTAINHPLGKNLIGAFHHPSAVFYELSFLETLPVREKLSGFAEIIKEACIGSPDFLQELMEEIDGPEKLVPENLYLPLKKGILVKKHFVERDEREESVRAFLNFGHTLGHALEKEMGYGRIAHGEAVATGMVFALSLSGAFAGFCAPYEGWTGDWLRWLETLGYRTKLPASLSPERLAERMKLDKKREKGRLRFVLLRKIGEPELAAVPEAAVIEHLTRMKGA
ncbi:MAG: 3-dehydroquinate synthase [Caldibacillus debilis]|jgi:3-dehydroquinate synthase|uniref:3-dehydroquinate synthase n=1 Tax=Caldibacillus debilis TaxID=301148 RepID=A0A3E0K1R6_9BACI|nr:3-dehydroquinate synthase [Caldibacillus debilis]MBO2480771.1 3-dehydroquinate synthase [Bacillaceae bacterium]OUM93021.1 MAG: 3-dehydroquinate synthase [Caldibacillus debilis]REJ26905.1 MAG: 3-dehydroquinate synthase [Caldibacillus debilis]